MKDGKLVKPSLQENFDCSRYLGDWYEIYRSKSITFESGTDITARYSADPEHPGRINLTNLQTLPNGKINTITGYAGQRKPNGLPSDLRVRFNWFLRGKYQIIRTDYDTFSIVYSARSAFFGLMKKECCWILGRKRDFAQSDPETVDLLFKIIEEETGMTRNEFISTPHTV